MNAPAVLMAKSSAKKTNKKLSAEAERLIICILKDTI